MSLFYKIAHATPDHETVERKATVLTKAISIVCTTAMINVLLLPAAAAAENNRNQQTITENQAVAGQNAYEQLVNLTTQYQLQTQSYQTQRQDYLAGRSIYRKMVDGVTNLFTDNDEDVNLYNSDTVRSTSTKLEKIAQQLAADQQTLLTELNTQKQKLAQTGNTQAVADQDKLISEMQARYQTLQKLVQAVNAASDPQSQYNALKALNKQLNDWQPKKPQTDMTHLPWGMPDNKVRQPIVSQNDANAIKPASFSTRLTTPHSAIHQWRNTEYRIGQYLLNNVSTNNPLAMNIATSGMSQAGQWTVLNALPAQVQQADLGETDDIQITDAIKAKAKELDNNPAKIYKWVHDNIEYVPTYGSIQGSDYTLQTLRGNDTDTASLLIALLRASGIPARYVYGTVDIPAKQAMDWVGGVNNIDAAQNLLGQGGVPSVALMSGSEPKYLRLEHTWVEANVSNLPAKGSIPNTADNQTNTWIPLDASYKSYVRTKGIDIAKAVPFDAQKLIDQAKAGATVDEATGSVKNLNQAAVNTAIQDYQKQVEAYLQQNHPNATVGDVLGTSKIKAYKSQFLSPVLPYQVKTVISDYQKLPDGMKHYFQMQLFESTDNGLYGGNIGYQDVNSPSAEIKIPTTKLQGKPLALSFKPTSKADEDTLLSYLPKDDKSPLPTSLPTSINMTPELTLDGEVLLSKGSYKLGSGIKLKYGYSSPYGGSLPSLLDKDIVAGSYYAIGYNLQGMSQAQLEKTKKTLEDTKAKLEKFQASKNEADLDGLTKDSLTGAFLQANVQSYFAINDAQANIAQKQADIITNSYMSIGTFSTKMRTDYRYGIATRVTPVGLNMDIDRILSQTVNKDNDNKKVIAYNQAMGMLQSLNENAVPEMLMNTKDEKNVEGVSAVKAIQLATQQGQALYTITKDNYAEILPKLNHDSETMSDIRNAINAGKVITVHASAINHLRWHGTGYIITDTATGAGAYMISGGFNGGDLQGLNDFNDFLGLITDYFLEPVTIFLKIEFPLVSKVIDWIALATSGVNALADCGPWGLTKTLLISSFFWFLSYMMSAVMIGLMISFGFLAITMFLATILLNMALSKAEDDAIEAFGCKSNE